MFRICLIMLAGLAVTLLAAGPVVAEKVEVKGPHICCPQCIKIVGGILGKVDGVSDAKCDKEAKTIAFTAKDEATVKNALKALTDGGFFGSATCDDKEVKLEVATVKTGDKADKVTVQKVHVCCGQCQKAIKGIFKDANVTFAEKGPQRTVIIEGTGLDRGEVIEALRKAGFNGTVEK